MMMRYFMFFLTITFTLQSFLVVNSYSNSFIQTLPGYSGGHLPFKLETGYVGVGEKEDVQLFYLFVESRRNSKDDPLILHLPGGPGASALLAFSYNLGPLNIKWGGGADNPKLTMSPNALTDVANVIFVDIPVGTGFSYSETDEGWISSDTIIITQATQFIKKFLRDHPKFMRSPLYISGISYIGMVVPKLTLELYEGNEREAQQVVNIQGYIIFSPFTDKFTDFNSRLEYAHRMALISDDIYQSATGSCHGNYVDISSANNVCSNILQRYEECIAGINLRNILEPFCNDTDPMQDCDSDLYKALNKWANIKVVQQALNIREGKIGRFEVSNSTLHYQQGKNDTSCYSYDIDSSFKYHKKLSDKNCRALILSGDHDLTFPYVGVEQWIASLDLKVEAPWKPFYVNSQVGGYETRYAQNNYSLTFATIKGSGHQIPSDKPEETIMFIKGWFSSQTYLSDY